ncbi:hypothetical protein M758_10G040500 [Ceratodon purpureus]|nr:hypothetical protein M758_10G040500 [Ceratodon purpureus]
MICGYSFKIGKELMRMSVARNGGLSYGVLFAVSILSLVFLTEAGAEGIPRTVKLMCSKAHDPDSCQTSLAAHPNAAWSGPRGLATIGINNAMGGVNSFHTYTGSLRSRRNGAGEDSALVACQSVLQDSQDQLQVSLSTLAALNTTKFKVQMADTLTWLSSALTDHMTCLEGVSDMSTSGTKDAVMSRAGSVTTLLANAVALVATVSRYGAGVVGIDGHSRRLLEIEQAIDSTTPVFELEDDGSPEWMRPGDRKLLQTGALNNLTIVNAVVAKDGSGNYKSIQAAIDAAPTNNSKKWIIQVKAGVYSEYVEVPKSAKNLVLIGAGIGKTIITGSKSVVGSNLTTFLTATMSVLAPNFLGRDFTVRNTAGAINHQAVALKVQGDKSAFWRCGIEGYQDTLYTHSNRQFFRECTISGTIDFIFGNAAAVFQSCTLLFRTPLPGQQNTLTAQGRTTSSQNTGLSFQNCIVDAAPGELLQSQPTVQSYLGRPWKEFSRTVFLTSSVTRVVDPAGWLPWNGDFALATLFYGEYRNSGAGAATGGRVKWATVITDAGVANQFTVNPFLMGAEWLPQTSVAYSPALYSN